MKSSCALVLVFFVFISLSVVPNAPAQASARTDVYHVHFAKAALGKGAEEGDYLKKQGPGSTMPGHFIVVRHQSGEDWDYAVIEHLGTSATVNAAGTAVPAAARDLSAWHTDTFVNGPPWPEFAKALGIDEGSAANSAGSVYVVSVYRAAPGRRDELEKSLGKATPGAAGNVLMQHLEGGPWQYLTIVRYTSWQDYGTSEKNSMADTLKPDGGWIGIRNYATYHNDTIGDRIAP